MQSGIERQGVMTACALGSLVGAIGLAVLAGWILDISWLRGAMAFGTPMKANAALCLAAQGIALAVLSIGPLAPSARRTVAALAAATAIFALASLLQDLLGVDFGIDEILVEDGTGRNWIAFPGRMSPSNAFSLSLSGVALVLMAAGTGFRGRDPVVRALAIATLLIGATALIGAMLESALDLAFLRYSRITTVAGAGVVLAGAGMLAWTQANGQVRWVLEWRTTAGFVAGIAAMVLMAGISHQYTDRLRADDAKVKASQDLLEEINRAKALFSQFTLSAGRFVITRDERTLETREGIKSAVDAVLSRLHAMVAGRQGYAERLARAGRLHLQRVPLSEAIIADVRREAASGRERPAQAGSPLGIVYPAMGEEIDRLMDELEQMELQHQTELRLRAMASTRKSFLALPLAALLATTVLLIGLFMLNAAAVEREQAQSVAERRAQKLEYLARYDELTGLPNRRQFLARLPGGLRSRGGEAALVAVAVIDIERFRQINQSLGREGGDDLLRQVSIRLQRVNDTVARVGADQFALVLRGGHGAADVNRTLDGVIRRAFTDPVEIKGHRVHVAFRAGVSLFPDDGDDPEVLLRNAEAALRRSRDSADRVVFYAADMNARVAETLAMETRLREAIGREELVLHYQPKVALPDRRIAGAEALMRWQDPGRGLVPPARFIPILEETGLIADAGRWAVRRALADARAFEGAGKGTHRIAVNVSAHQLRRKDFVDGVIDDIQGAGDHPERLELEITESLLMHDFAESTRKLAILRGMGVTVAIDDFGTGYSSLSYLSRLPVDSLKIDRSFVSEVTSDGHARGIVEAVITLAHGLGLKVVAEGVETREQADLLGELRCDEAQGYYFSRPVPEAEFRTLLAGGVLPRM